MQTMSAGSLSGCSSLRLRTPAHPGPISSKRDVASRSLVKDNSFYRTTSLQAESTVVPDQLDHAAPSSVPGPAPGFLRALAAPHGASPAECGRQARALLDEQLKEAGALLFEDLPFADDQAAVEEFVDALGLQQVPYQPLGAPRQKIGKLDAATNAPQQMIIPVHNEMAYNPQPAGTIMLLCLRPAERGGENVLVRNTDATSALPDSIMRKFDQKGGIRYVREYPRPDRAATEEFHPLFTCPDWKSRTGKDSPEDAVQYWKDLGFTEVSFSAEGTLVVANTQPACICGPTGQSVFFNNASFSQPAKQAGPFGMITYGDGDRIEQETVSEIKAAQWKAACALRLNAGSMLALDNRQVMHGRMPYEGNQRKMLTVLSND